jgi:hypothetical protein
MSRYWRISSVGHEIPYYAYAPNREAALKAVDIVLGGHNPAKLLVMAITPQEVPEDTGVFGKDDE